MLFQYSTDQVNRMNHRADLEMGMASWALHDSFLPTGTCEGSAMGTLLMKGPPFGEGHMGQGVVRMLSPVVLVQ